MKLIHDKHMSEDYQKIGFMCGLEIHNRLATKHKLFCSCPPKFSSAKPIKQIKRNIRAVSGESGKTDAAALFQAEQKKDFIYDCFKNETCLVETDSEPPHNINMEALEVVLQIAKLLKAEIPDEIHVMRKIVVDGSNTSGFQRTMIIGMNGILETSLGDVKIPTICLEEEAAAIIEQREKETFFRLDRLGMPLIEIATDPSIKGPEHAKEVAEKIGMIIRSTGKSQRGIGVTRQDINISIVGGARIEIKGFQELEMIPKVIEDEVARQILLVSRNESKEETRVVKADGATEFLRPLPGGERMYPETDIPPFIITKDFLKKIKIPETWEQKKEKFEAVLPKDMAGQVLRSEYLELFEKFYKKYDPILTANLFISILKDLKRKGIKTENLEEKHFESVLMAVAEKKTAKESMPGILETFCSKPEKTVGEVISESGLSLLTEEDLRKIIKSKLAKYPDLIKENKFGALMGEVMNEVRGRLDGKTISKILKEEMEANNPGQ